MRRAVHVCVCAAALTAAVGATPLRAAVFEPEIFTLSNGLQVVVVNNPRAPVVRHMIWYKTGAADEAPGESGVAHFLEHLMFKGTERFPDGVFSETVARNGGRENAFTSRDYTAYHQTVARDRLELVMEMEADRMTNLTLTLDQIETERDVVLEERRERTESAPANVLAEQAGAVQYLNYPYRRPVIGWAHEISSLTRGAITAFYKKWYAPNNAVLAVEGDITAAELRPLAERTYGRIPRAQTPPRLRADEPPQRAERRVTHRDARVRQPALRISYLAPSDLWGDTARAPALEVIAETLGGGATSYLYRRLVIESGVAVSAGAYYAGGRLGPGQFVIYAAPKPGISVELLEGAVGNVLDQFFDGGMTAEDVNRAKERMRTAAIFARDSFGAGARSLGAAFAMGGAAGMVEDWPERIAAVTPEAADGALRAVFNGPSVTSLLLPPENEE
ncbi:MAG: M16 family metallopeptidase [Rhodospirillales bacterium]